MKKLLYIFLFAVLILSGCEKKQELLAPASLFEMDGEATAAGVCPGDGPEEFKAAYRDYTAGRMERCRVQFYGDVS